MIVGIKYLLNCQKLKLSFIFLPFLFERGEHLFERVCLSARKVQSVGRLTEGLRVSDSLIKEEHFFLNIGCVKTYV